jgi:lipopolysaccharide/colanic/teichoic acid biosynthesis glycosyltransferase
MNPLRSPAKRAIDVCGATAALAIFAPVLVLIALAIWRSLGRPVLFRQLRAGSLRPPFRAAEVPDDDRRARRCR